MAKVSEETQWQARDDLSTLQRAEEIRKDKSRMAAANTEAQKQMNALKKVAGSTKKVASKKKAAAKRMPSKPRNRPRRRPG